MMSNIHNAVRIM